MQEGLEQPEALVGVEVQLEVQAEERGRSWRRDLRQLISAF